MAVGGGTITTLTTTSDITVQGVTVGRGAGAVSTNTAIGNGVFGNSIPTGTNNLAIGYQASYNLTSAVSTVAIGRNAAYINTTGGDFVAIGRDALYSNTTGSYSVAIGEGALLSNTTASNNTAVGYQAGYTNVTGQFNAFFGQSAGYASTGGQNTFIGTQSGVSMTTGSKNTILGEYSGNQGGLDIRTASNYIVLSDGDGNPRLYLNGSGYPFFPQVRSNAGSYTAKWTTSAELVLDTSSARYKDNIRDSAYGLSHVMQIRSAMFEYKADGRTDVGLVAEELDLIIPELVTKNAENQPDAVSYDRMVSVLVKAIQELKAEIDTLKGQA
jgi:hypothetical protein